jgi:PAS domain S-box-containing protein
MRVCEEQRAAQEKRLAEQQVEIDCAREELQSMRRLLRAGTISVDQYGKIQEVGAAFCELCDYRPEELIGKSFLILVPGRFHVPYRTAFEKVMSREWDFPTMILPAELRRKNADEIRVMVVLSLFQNGSGPKLKADVRRREIPIDEEL